ncbi:MAG: protein kinase domain-containing protein, partial [Anaerolineales bacterium]
MRADLSGHSIGDYTLQRLIGEGGMGAVYESFQRSVERKVAIKVLPAALAQQPGYLERFNQEVRVAASLEHIHILPVYDYGTHEGMSYIVMRYLTGGDLGHRLVNQPKLPRGKAQKLLFQIADALDFAHSQGVVHRDLKPNNIMFDDQDNAYLMDFGIAKVVGMTGMTGTGQVIGTPMYMAPEQWTGDEVDARTDVYAFAVMTYQILTGTLPFQAETPAALMFKHLNAQPDPINALDPSLPDAVNDVFYRALDKDRGARFPSAGAFIRAMDASMVGGVTRAPTPAPDERTLIGDTPPPQSAPPIAKPVPDAGQAGSRRGWLLPAIVIIGLLGLGVIALAVLGGGEAEIEGDDGDVAVALATDDPTAEPTQEPTQEPTDNPTEPPT